jgi:hypothetical protein
VVHAGLQVDDAGLVLGPGGLGGARLCLLLHLRLLLRLGCWAAVLACIGGLCSRELVPIGILVVELLEGVHAVGHRCMLTFIALAVRNEARM